MKHRAAGVLVLGTLLVGAAATAAAQEPAVTVAAVGTGQVGVKPDDRKSEASIRRAVEAARPQAVRLAIRNARGEATIMAEEAGLELGGVVGVESYQTPYGPGPGIIYGRFGPDRFCGITTRPIRRLDPQTGRRVVVRRVRQRRCFVPPFVSASVEVTYSAAPASG